MKMALLNLTLCSVGLLVCSSVDGDASAAWIGCATPVGSWDPSHSRTGSSISGEPTCSHSHVSGMINRDSVVYFDDDALSKISRIR
jgi:hypothetical protein